MKQAFHDFELQKEYSDNIEFIYKRKIEESYHYVVLQKDKYGYGLRVEVFVSEREKAFHSIEAYAGDFLKGRKLYKRYSYYSQAQLNKRLDKIGEEIQKVLRRVG